MALTLLVLPAPCEACLAVVHDALTLSVCVSALSGICRWRGVPQGLGGFYGVGLGLAVDEVAVPPPPDKPGSGNGGGGKSGEKDMDSPIVCLRGISFSAWNPPPPQRRMVGDILYLEVSALGVMFPLSLSISKASSRHGHGLMGASM